MSSKLQTSYLTLHLKHKLPFLVFSCICNMHYICDFIHFLRWHNHLNPNINKEAWTQDEELALIRAHQVYGNKWAELTKFLPGRYTD